LSNLWACVLPPPPNKLAAVAEEVEAENGGSGRKRPEEKRREIRMVEHNTSFYTHFCMIEGNDHCNK
jgi:hypothetical protein